MHYTDAAHDTFQQHESGSYEVVPPVNNNMGASGHNPYEFIVSPNSGSSKLSNPLAGGSFGKQIGIFAGAALVIIIGLWIAFSALSPKGNTADLLAITERQQEIIRIGTAATAAAGATDVRNFVSNTNVSVTSDQQQLIAYLAKHGTKVGGKQLALDKNVQTDALLANAQAAGNYDGAVTQTLGSQLTTYEQLLKSAYNQTTSKSGKQLLQQIFTHTEALANQAKTIQGTD